MKIKHTSRIISSLLALVSCITMLVGSTFAWFTDSSVSGNNVIQSGNIDLGVEYTVNGKDWNALDGATDLFQNGLWEPGHTEVVALRIKNNGSLALKYVANMNIVDEIIGKTKDGQSIVLSDILTVSTLVQQSGQIGDICLSLAFNGENRVAYEQTSTFKDSNILRKDVELLPNDEHYLIIKVDMAETVGNEFNHNGIDVPEIKFGINVLATQFTYENDTFGNQYDKNAEYPALPDTWDGTAGYSWFDPNKDEYTLKTAEDFVGFSTKYGDLAGDFSLFKNYCVSEVLQIGDYLGLPKDLVHKVPSDGMCGMSDEEKMGFTYQEVDNMLLHNELPEYEKYKKIIQAHENNKHKECINLPAPKKVMWR